MQNQDFLQEQKHTHIKVNGKLKTRGLAKWAIGGIYHLSKSIPGRAFRKYRTSKICRYYNYEHGTFPKFSNAITHTDNKYLLNEIKMVNLPVCSLLRKKTKTVWTRELTEELVDGINELGVGKWVGILQLKEVTTHEITNIKI